MRYELLHPTAPSMSAAYGWDRSLGFWVEVTRAGRQVASYDALDTPGGQSSVNGLLQVLIDHEFFTDNDRFFAAGEIQVCDDIEDIEEPAVRLAAQVILNLKRAAGE